MNLDHFWRSYERKTEIRYLLNRWLKKFQNLPGRVFWWVLKKYQKNEENQKFKFFKSSDFSWNAPITIWKIFSRKYFIMIIYIYIYISVTFRSHFAILRVEIYHDACWEFLQYLLRKIWNFSDNFYETHFSCIVTGGIAKIYLR